MSLRTRLLIGMALVALVLAGTGLAVAQITEAQLLDEVDAQLRSASAPARDFDEQRGPDHGPDDGPDDGPDGDSPDGEAAPLSDLYVATIEDGVVVTLATPNLRSDELPPPDITVDEAVAAADGDAFTVASVDGGLDYRVLASTDGRTGRTTVTAIPLDDVDEAVGRLLRVGGLAIGLALVVLALVTWWVMRLGVRPIKVMTRTATAIADGDLSHRVPEGDPRTEAGELGEALNRMLGEIEEAFDERTRSEDRLRQFVADASHELRTPVATIRGYAELYRVGGLRDEADLDDAMRRTEQEARRMGALVDDLLLLNRLDQGRPLERAPVDLAQLARDAALDATAVDPTRAVDVDLSGTATVDGDEDRLRQVIGNLVGNALAHTAPGTPVAIRVTAGDDDVVLEVSDEGPGMEPEVAAHAFDRFYRGDPARSRHRGGSGLGLAIVAATVEAHSGTVALQTAPGDGARFRVVLPAAHPPP